MACEDLRNFKGDALSRAPSSIGGAVASYTAPADALKFGCLISTPTRINDLFLIDGKSSGDNAQQLTHSNDPLFSKLNLTEPEEISYQSFDRKKIQAWLMLVLGEDDTRTPLGAGGEQMFRALKFRKIPTVMVKFPRKTHELSRSSEPWHRIERFQHIIGWFDHWLLGSAKPEYEVGPQDEVPIKKKSVPGPG